VKRIIFVIWLATFSLIIDGAVHQVNNSAGDLSNGSIREILQNDVANGDTVYFDNISGATINLSGQIELNTPGIFIDAGNNNITLNGGGTNRIMSLGINADNVVLKNLVFQNGSAERGGAIILEEDVGDDVANNLQIANCEFYDNVSINGHEGGAIWAEPTKDANGKLIILNSIFGRNESEVKDGGAMNIHRMLLIIDGCTFYDNSADILGGAICTEAQVTRLTNSIFRNNYAKNGGGGYAISYNSDSTFIEDCLFEGNTTANIGGALFLQKNFGKDTPLRLYNSVFRNNKAVVADGNGGAIGMDNESSMTGDVDYVIMNCLFTGNLSNNNGGAIYQEGPSVARFNIVNSTFYGNESDYDASGGGNGGGVNLQEGNVINCVFYGNNDNNVIAKSVSYSAFPGSSGTNNNINLSASPFCGSQCNQQYSLKEGSACIDAGDNTAIPVDVFDLDNDGNRAEQVDVDMIYKTRVLNGIVNMGAYEYMEIFITLEDVTRVEGLSGTTIFNFTVKLSSVLGIPFEIDYTTQDGTATTADNDYVAKAGVLTIPAGDSTGVVSISINGDNKYENNDTFTVYFSGQTEGTLNDSIAKGTIVNDDPIPEVTISSFLDSIPEIDGTDTITATLSNPTIQDVTVNMGFAGSATGSGIDYVASGNSITITTGSTSGKLSIECQDDNIFEQNESVIININSVTNAIEKDVQQESTIIIDDEGEPNIILSKNVNQVIEGNTGSKDYPFAVSLNRTASMDIIVRYNITDQNARQADGDYTHNIDSIIINSGVLTDTINIQVNSDTICEPDERFVVQLTNASFGNIIQSIDTGIIQNDDNINGGAVFGDQDICYLNSPSKFNSLSAGGGGIYEYQWQKMPDGYSTWLDIQDATGTAFNDTSQLKKDAMYRRKAIPLSCTDTAYSDTISVHVYDSLIAGQIGGTQNICYNTSPLTFNNILQASGGSGISYQWEKQNQGGSWSDIANENDDTLNIATTLDDTTYFRRKANAGACGTAFSNTITVNVYPKMDGGIIGSDQSLKFHSVPDTIKNITTPSGGIALTYQWEKKTDTSNWEIIAGATNDAFFKETDTLDVTTLYRRKTLSVCDTVYSNTVSVLIYKKVSAGIIGNDTNVCYDTRADTFINIFSPFADTSYTIHWQRSYNTVDWANIPNANDTLFRDSLSVIDTVYYRRKVVSILNDSSFSNIATVTPYQPLFGGLIDSNQVICYNTSPAAFINDSSASGGGGLSYQWQRKSESAPTWYTIPLAISDIFSDTNLITGTTFYRRVAISSKGCGTASSDTVVVTTYEPVFGGSIGPGQEICFNTVPAIFSNDSIASGGGGMIYLWERKNAGTLLWDTILLASDSAYQETSKLKDTMQYRRIASSVMGCGEDTSNVLDIIVYDSLKAGLIGYDDSIYINTSPDTIVNIQHASDGGGYTYQWQYRSMQPVPGNWDIMPGATHSFLVESNMLTSSMQYRRLAQSAKGCDTVSSNIVNIHIYEKIQPGNISLSDTSPTDTICFNHIPPPFISSNSASGGGGYDYQWQQRVIEPVEGAWSNIPGADSASFTDYNRLAVGRQYRRLASARGGEDTAYSDTITINVYAKIEAGTVGNSQIISHGNKPDTFVNIVAPSGGVNLSYQWQKTTDTANGWVNQPDTGLNYAENDTLTKTTFYRRLVVSGLGCGSDSSNIIKITVLDSFLPGVIMISDSLDNAICYGSVPAAFVDSTEPVVSTDTFYYQWQKKEINGNWFDIPGAVNQSYQEDSALTNTTSYRRKIITSLADTIFSNVLDIIVYNQMSGGDVGDDQNICYQQQPDAFISYSPATGGGGMIHYQWQAYPLADSVWINRSPNGQSEFYSETRNLTGSFFYRRMATSARGCGPAYSDTILVNVYDKLNFSLSASDSIIIDGQSITLQVADITGGGNSPYMYYWDGHDENNQPYLNVESAETIKVHIEDDDGCISDTHMIAIKESLFIPQAISPNADGYNDIFEIRGLQPYNYSKIMIFNKYQEVVFTASPYQNNWDGSGLPDGTYYYILYLEDTDPITGFVELVTHRKIPAK
jgi:gliding motility-associated-like protein